MHGDIGIWFLLPTLINCINTNIILYAPASLAFSNSVLHSHNDFIYVRLSLLVFRYFMGASGEILGAMRTEGVGVLGFWGFGSRGLILNLNLNRCCASGFLISGDLSPASH